MKRPAILAFLLLSAAVWPAAAREPISVVATPAAFPLAVQAAEQFSLKQQRPMPVVERLESDRGAALFCAGRGPGHPDVLATTRQADRAGLGACARNGFGVAALRLGHQAVALARTSGAGRLALTRRQIFLALARELPLNGRLMPNPYRLWSDIDLSLPVAPIQVLGPPPLSPLRQAFTDLVMAPAAAQFPALRGRDPGLLRDDGAFIALDAEEARVAAELARRPDALAVLSFNAFSANTFAAQPLQPLPIEGVVPDAAAIAEGRYPLSRPWLLYVKPAQVKSVAGLRAYLAEITGEAAAGPGGYLTRRGLVPLPPDEAAAQRAAVRSLPPL